MTVFTAAVIGLGGIGQGFDYEAGDCNRVLTHAAAFSCHPHFELVAGVDPDPGARQKFEKKFGRPAFAAVRELYKAAAPEVLALAVPTPLHFEVFKEVISHSPKAIVCEKPLALKLAEGQMMNDLAAAAQCLLLVNYLRRFEPQVLELKKRIAQKEFGEIYKGTVWYSKGIMNNGSHFIDLLMFWFGEVTEIEVLHPGRKIRGDDPEPDVRMKFGGLDMYFLAGREECFSIRELELLGTSGWIKYSRGGEEIITKKTGPHPLFPGYTVLEEEGQLLKTDLPRYQWHVVDALYRAMVSGAPLNSTGVTALATLTVVDRILNRVKELTHV